jgi:arginyl-tRNA synthetase
MPTVLTLLDAAFRAPTRSAVGVDADPAITVSQNEAFGDYQSNAAMGLAKRLSEGGTKTNPRQLAERVRAALDLSGIASETSIGGPGFINVRLSPEWLAKQVQAVATDDRLGVDLVSKPQTVVVDYSGPNVAKQMHVGHLRSTIIGDAIARVLAFRGDTVIRQNHIGDWGTQFGMLIAFMYGTESGSVMRAVGPDGPEAVRDPSEWHVADLEEFYRAAKTKFDADASFQNMARRAVVELQQGRDRERHLWRLIVDESRRHYLPLYARLGASLTQGDERGESFYNSLLPDVVRGLRDVGIAVQSEGAVVVFNDGHKDPIVIEKTGGGFLYATTDLAAIRFRTTELHADRIIYTHDSRQIQHFAQVFATAKRAGWADGVQLDYAPFGTMLGEDGKPFKTRSGDTVKLTDLLNEAEERAMAVVTAKSPELPDEQKRSIARAVGIGGVKYSDLSKDRVSDYVFSWDKMLALDGNTAPYLQYAYARIQSIFRRAAERGIDVSRRPFAAPVALNEPHERALAVHVLRFGDVVELVARELKPHHLCTYLYELATRFSGFFENCPVLPAEEPVRSSRLTLCEAAGRTMAQGLDLLGIEHPEQM